MALSSLHGDESGAHWDSQSIDPGCDLHGDEGGVHWESQSIDK